MTVMKPKTTLMCSFLLLAWLASPVDALEVYQWTDEDGVLHFSQWAPEEDHEGVTTVNVDDGEDTANGLGISEEDDPEGYQAHREQMDALWADLEARREADRERQQQVSRTEVIYTEPVNSYPYVFPGYGYRPGHRPPNKPGRPPNRPRPQPGVDPEDPGRSGIAPGTLKRP